jgi:hypothetical protein
MKISKIKQHFLSAFAFVFFIFIAFGSSDTKDSTVDIKATVFFDGAQFTISNNDTFDYKNARLQLNDKYYINSYTLKAGGIYTVGMMQFADDDGNRFDLMKKPQNFSIWCDIENDKNGFYFAEWK